MSESGDTSDTLRESVLALRRRLLKSPRDLQLPYDDWRTGQRKSIRAALHSKKRHRLIQAPTGSGKSLIAASLPKMRPTDRVVTLTATNALLSQYRSTFDFFALVKGARNYECLAAHDELSRFFRMIKRARHVTCDDGPCRAGVKCSLKENGCTYYDAVRAASISKSPLTNYAYWLAMRRYAGGLGQADTLICDEAHSLPEQLMSAHAIHVQRHELRGDRQPTSIRQWKELAARNVTRLRSESAEDEDVRVRKIDAIDRFSRLADIDSSWAYDVTNDGWTFEPVVPRNLFPLIADESTNLVYLSATATPTTLALLGIDPADIDVVQLPSQFATDRRPIYLLKTCRVDYRMSYVERQYWLDRHDTIIRHRLDRKGVIHCSSYDRLRDIVANSKYKAHMIAPSDSRELARAVETFRAARPPSILVSPAVEQGFDFPYDECEYQIISKIPFPNTQSAIMQARIKATAEYKEHLTMQRLVQSVGRGMRAKDDSCETFILDDHARWFVNKFAHLAPQSFLDSIVYSASLARPLPKLARH